MVVRPLTVVVPPDRVSVAMAPASTPTLNVPALNAPPAIVSVPPVKLASPVTLSRPLLSVNVPPVAENVPVDRAAEAFVMLIVPRLRMVAPLTFSVVAAVLNASVACAAPTVSAAIVAVVSSDTQVPGR